MCILYTVYVYMYMYVCLLRIIKGCMERGMPGTEANVYTWSLMGIGLRSTGCFLAYIHVHVHVRAAWQFLSNCNLITVVLRKGSEDLRVVLPFLTSPSLPSLTSLPHFPPSAAYSYG